MKVTACAKINLGLNVVARRADGYHDLETVFYPVGIHDEISVEPIDGAVPRAELTVDGGIPVGDNDNNLVVRAYRLVAEHHRLPPVRIRLQKRIPVQAGMGGGSADGAFTIRALNELFSLGLSSDEMRALAVQLGADCPFFIDAVPAYAEGVGERLEPMELDLSSRRLVVVKPPVAVSTREAFAGITPRRPVRNCRDIVGEPMETWRHQLVNDFEEGIFRLHPELGAIKQKLYDIGAVYAAMSGSGSALFGFFNVAPQLSNAFNDCQKWII